MALRCALLVIPIEKTRFLVDDPLCCIREGMALRSAQEPFRGISRFPGLFLHLNSGLMAAALPPAAVLRQGTLRSLLVGEASARQPESRWRSSS